MDYFNLKFHNTTVKNEIFAGIALFIAMSYILVVNPTILSGIGMDYQGVFLATVLASAFSTFISAFYTKLPIALAPGLGMSAIFVSFATGENSISWQALLLATYVSGIIICAFVHLGFFDAIMEIMDMNFRLMIMAGIGFALFLYGLSTVGILEKRDGYYWLGEFNYVAIVICAITLLIIFVLKKLNVKGFLLFGLLAAYVMSISWEYMLAYEESGITITKFLKEITSISYEYNSLQKVMFKFPNVMEFVKNREEVIIFINAVFVFTMGHFFDAIGTNTASFEAINTEIDTRMKGTMSLKRAIMVDGVANIASGLFGTSTVTAYAESLVGIVSGGKTGITALTTACLFLLCIFFAPLFTSMAIYVAAPALIYVGISLLMRYKKIDCNKKAILILGICIILYTGITFNIGNAVLYGLVVYSVLKWILEKKLPRKSWIVLIFAVVHILLNFLV